MTPLLIFLGISPAVAWRASPVTRRHLMLRRNSLLAPRRSISRWSACCWAAAFWAPHSASAVHQLRAIGQLDLTDRGLLRIAAEHRRALMVTESVARHHPSRRGKPVELPPPRSTYLVPWSAVRSRFNALIDRSRIESMVIRITIGFIGREIWASAAVPERQTMEPGMAAGAAQLDRLPRRDRMMARTLSVTIRARRSQQHT